MAEMPELTVEHRVRLAEPRNHLVAVETSVGTADGSPLPDAIVLFMPVWTPGSYLVREYARNVEGLATESAGPALAGQAHATKVRKNAWRVETAGAARVTVRYRVYAGELTVRTCHVDDSHAFLVGAALFLGVEGHESLGARIDVVAPAGWRSATPLAAAPARDPEATHSFVAPDFDTLVDSPIELGTHREETFDVLGRPHRYALWPAAAFRDADVRRLVDDTRSILETTAKLFGGELPYLAYDLLLHLSSRGRGGLEHRSSAALIASPSSFTGREGYLELLSLVAHETFHAWNVKRIRPAGLTPYRYEQENYTRLLWWFEGATSYYDSRILALSRLATLEEYLDHLSGEISYLDQTPGRLFHPLEETSFDAWIKLYRPDENSTNSSVSYYRKGELVCALLDIEIRDRSSGKASLDAVLAHLWSEYGKRERPVPEAGMQAIFEHVAGVPLGDLFDAWIRSSAEIDYDGTLAKVGLAVERTARADGPPCSLGVRSRSDGGRTVVASVVRDSAAWRAGIDAGDELIAIDRSRIEGGNVDAALRAHAPGDVVDVLLARDGAIITRHAKLDPQRRDRVRITARPDAATNARDAFAAWLGEPHPAWSGVGVPGTAT
jgi:predicted metalloprotease with PDZ domain